ncbi:MAG: glycosyltransferase family 39 protein [Anaerolineae bacterium]|nr:glycosyltransferase family 39 protein [Anaerolineae bacterium]
MLMSDVTLRESDSPKTLLFLKPTRWVVNLLLVLFLLAGFAARFIDFADLPLDFAATRQLHSFIMARGIYYQMDTPDTLAMAQDLRGYGINTGNAESRIEPPIMEYLAAFTYRLIGQENILVPRLLSMLFWVLGGIPLFLLARKLMNINGAYAALAAYLFIPFGVLASRSFQPDPLMVMTILWALFFQIRWSDNSTMKNAVLAGVFTGIALFVKAPTAFFVGFSFAGLILSKGFKNWIKNPQIYLMAALALLPAIVFNAISATVGGNAYSIFGTRFFPQYFIDPKWYSNWLQIAKSVTGYFPLVLGVLAIFLIKVKQNRVFYFCLWLGYILYGFTFAYHIYTHNYYHLPLIPTISLGLGFFFAVIFEKLEASNLNWVSRTFVMLILLFSIGLCVQVTRGNLIAKDYRHEAKYWTDLGASIGGNASVIALTHDNGYRISYWGYVNPKLWPTAGDRTIKSLVGATDPAFQQMFKELALGKDYFLVTLNGELELQPDLRDHLFATYPYQQGDGYYLFDLRQTISQ